MLLVTYALGYLLLMDRSRPTAQSMYGVFFESSLRTVPTEWADFAHTLPGAPRVTIFNVVFQPAERIYFTLFPRSDEELDRRAKAGH